MNGMSSGRGSCLSWSEYQRRMASAVTRIGARKKLVFIYLVQICESDVVNRLLILSYLQMKMGFLYFEFFFLCMLISLCWCPQGLKFLLLMQTFLKKKMKNRLSMVICWLAKASINRCCCSKYYCLSTAVINDSFSFILVFKKKKNK